MITDWGAIREHAKSLALGRGLTLADAEDVAQTVTLRIWRRRDVVDRPHGYLLVAVRNEVTTLWRTRGRMPTLSAEEVAERGDNRRVGPLDGYEVAAECRDPALMAIEAETMLEVMAKLARLLTPALQRILALLLLGLSNVEIAAHLGCSSVNVRVQKYRIRQRIREAVMA